LNVLLSLTNDAGVSEVAFVNPSRELFQLV